MPTCAGKPQRFWDYPIALLWAAWGLQQGGAWAVFTKSPRKSLVLVLRRSAQGEGLDFSLLLFNASPTAGARDWGGSPLLGVYPWVGMEQRPEPPGLSAELGMGSAGKTPLTCSVAGKGQGNLGCFRVFSGMNYSPPSVLSPRSFGMGERFFPIAFSKFALRFRVFRGGQRRQREAGIAPLF